MRRAAVCVLFVILSGAAVSGCSGANRGVAGDAAAADALARFRALRDSHVSRWSELESQWNAAWWAASLSGREEDFQLAQRLEIDVRRIHSDPALFGALRELRESHQISDPRLSRQLEVLYLAFAENQLDDQLMRRIVAIQTGLEQTFNTYRPEVDGEEVTANQVRAVLGESDDQERRRVMWEASKEVGRQIAPRLVDLARLRNQAARSMGFRDFYEMRLQMNEQDPAQIQQVFDELARLTEGPYRAAKAQLDARLAARFGVSVDELRPWHYADPFFQESPGAGIDLDPFFSSDDPDHLVAIARRFYESIGLPEVDEILARSDLFERDGKVEHAFCTHIDRNGDVRILTNLQNDERWMGTLLHELGHGVYDVHIDRSLPFELRSPAHTFTTEGVAELFGTLTRDPAWLRWNADVPPDVPANFAELVAEEHRFDLLIFARWTLVMVSFERAFYANPDQDLNALWWDVVERYQGLQRPDGVEGGTQWAAKIHLVVAPVYYHNYMLGRMYAAQLRHRISQVVPSTLSREGFDMQGQPAVGRFLIENVFRPGATLSWAEFVRESTGEELTARYFAEAIQPPRASAQ